MTQVQPAATPLWGRHDTRCDDIATSEDVCNVSHVSMWLSGGAAGEAQYLRHSDDAPPCAALFVQPCHHTRREGWRCTVPANHTAS